ncbi:BOS complex subunit ncln [Diachasmimorpha longicaudata]|uniref:BOS complex subunit ncln n=1 Tax=Diachasmimorpha longicaudata TaxID=58733 RepID=UPI0030B8748F
MWLEECDGFAELCRGYLPYYLLIVLPIFIVVSPVNPVTASHELPVYRMHQYDLHGVSHGCRSASIQLEARTLSSWQTSRHCVIARLSDITPDVFYAIKSKAGALILILPKDMKSLSQDEQQHILSLEASMESSGETTIPVYFSPWNPDLQTIVNDLEHGLITDAKANSELQNLINSISASGYQVIVPTGQPTPKTDVKIATIQGKLAGTGVEEKLPTVALVAHYDSSSVATELSFGAESNASGVAMLLELARLFSALYSINKSRAKYNIVFILSGAGKLNYQGSKKWLEDQFDGVDSSVIQDASYVICLDSVSKSDDLYLHVSKPPKENSFGSLFYKELSSIAQAIGGTKIEGIHKKINLAEESLAWEHERYSIRRLAAATLSSLKSHDDPGRSSLLDVMREEQIDRLHRHTSIVAEALARHLYGVNSTKIFLPPVEVSKESLSVWMNYLISQSRSVPLLADKNNPLVNSLQEIMSRYLIDVRTTFHTPDKRDPEFVFYDITKTNMNVYSVKPAVFDLFLTIAISLYLGMVYLIVHKFSHLYNFAVHMTVKNKVS